MRDRASRGSRVARDIQLSNSIYRLSIEDAAVWWDSRGAGNAAIYTALRDTRHREVERLTLEAGKTRASCLCVQLFKVRALPSCPLSLSPRTPADENQNARGERRARPRPRRASAPRVVWREVLSTRRSSWIRLNYYLVRASPTHAPPPAGVPRTPPARKQRTTGPANGHISVPSGITITGAALRARPARRAGRCTRLAVPPSARAAAWPC